MKDSALAFSFYTLLLTITGVLSIFITGAGLAFEKLTSTEAILYVSLLVAFIIINIVITFGVKKEQRWSQWFAVLEVATIFMYLLVTFIIDLSTGIFEIPYLALVHIAILAVLYSDLRKINNAQAKTL